jgi:hypothetical protein
MSEFENVKGMTPFDNTQAEGNTALAVMDEDERFIMDLTAERKTQFCSMVPKNEDEEIVLFNAMNNPDKRIGDCINMTINVKHVFCEVVTCVNRETGETNMCPRIVLIDTDGVGYQAVSLGVFSALKKIFAIKGSPTTWKKPVKLQVVQITKGDRKLLTFNMVK